MGRLSQDWRSPCFATGALRGLHWLILHGEILTAPGQAVLVRSAVSHRWLHEITVGRRRRRQPFQGGRLPRVIVHFLAVFDAPEEIDDERDLRDAHGPGGP